MRTISYVIDDKTEAALVALAAELKIPEEEFFGLFKHFVLFDDLVEAPDSIPNYYIYPNEETAALAAKRYLRDYPRATIELYYWVNGVEYVATFDSADGCDGSDR